MKLNRFIVNGFYYYFYFESNGCLCCRDKRSDIPDEIASSRLHRQSLLCSFFCCAPGVTPAIGKP